MFVELKDYILNLDNVVGVSKVGSQYKILFNILDSKTTHSISDAKGLHTTHTENLKYKSIVVDTDDYLKIAKLIFNNLNYVV